MTRGCRFIECERPADGWASLPEVYCGRRAVPGRSWCARHMRLVYEPRTGRLRVGGAPAGEEPVSAMGGDLVTVDPGFDRPDAA